jgi:hypothetical protein
MLVHFGLGDDPRVRRAFAFVIADMGRPDALDCSRCAHRECLWGAIAGLNGLADLPDDMRSGESDRIARRLANALLAAPMNKAVGAAAAANCRAPVSPMGQFDRADWRWYHCTDIITHLVRSLSANHWDEFGASLGKMLRQVQAPLNGGVQWSSPVSCNAYGKACWRSVAI